MRPFARARQQHGFSLLELTCVVVVIGILAAMGIKYYIDALDKARATGLEMLAWRFAQSTSVLHAWSSIPAGISPESHGVDARGIHWVKLDGTVIYLNENRWPATTDAARSPEIGQQTADDCQSLLDAMFKQPVIPVPTVGMQQKQEEILQEGQHGSSQKKAKQYDVFVIDGNACRYQLTQNKDEPWYFDYSLVTGEVRISVPKLRIEQYHAIR